MAAREHYSDKQLFGKGRAEQMDMLMARGVNWNDYPAFFKRGTYIQRRTVKRKLLPEDIEKLPPLHNAKKNPDLEIERHEYTVLDLPPLSKVRNRAEVLFFGAVPIAG
jgi:tRNA(His) 5'-end guanylyltransferase